MINTWRGPFGFLPFTVAGFWVLFTTIAIIVVILKGYALWHAAKRDEKWWFIILLIVNTLGILELIYLCFVVGKWRKVVEPTSLIAPDNSTNTSVPNVSN